MKSREITVDGIANLPWLVGAPVAPALHGVAGWVPEAGHTWRRAAEGQAKLDGSTAQPCRALFALKGVRID